MTPAAEGRAPLTPVQSGGRIVSLDLIRGVAVLGIVFANIVAFAQPLDAYLWPPAIAGGDTFGDRLLWFVQYVFIDHKMRGLFTLLFGAGIALFLEHAAARGQGEWLQVRRLLWLMVFGALHFYLLWDGDILTTYAFWGLAVLPLARRDTPALYGMALTLYLSGAILAFFQTGMAYVIADWPQFASQFWSGDVLDQFKGVDTVTLEASGEEIARVLGSGYLETVRYRFGETEDTIALILSGLIETPGLILLGMALYRSGFFLGEWTAAEMRRWGRIGLLGGIAISAVFGLWAWAAGFPLMLTVFVFEGLMMVPRLAFVLGLAALLVVGTPRIVQSQLGRHIVAAGRMAFTNYIGTSLLMLFVFPPWGLDLYARLHRVELLAIVLAVWAAMLLWSRAWLARFAYGPLEWLWRCLTYWRVFPLRRTTQSSSQ